MNSEKELRERCQVDNAARVAPVIKITPRANVWQIAQPTKLIRVTSLPLNVERAQIPYWQERGWSRRGNEFFGPYRVHNLSFAGKATESPSGDVEMFIRDGNALANIMAKHHKWSCFFMRPEGWLFVHAFDHIRDVSAGLIEVEAILAEAYETNKNQKHTAQTYHYDRSPKFSFASFIWRILG